MKSKIIYRTSHAYNAITGKKVFCIEARVEGKWMPVMFETGFFITESSTAAAREAGRRNRISFGNLRNPATGTGDRQTEREVAYLMSENDRLKRELELAALKKSPRQGPDEEDDPALHMFDENKGESTR